MLVFPYRVVALVRTEEDNESSALNGFMLYTLRVMEMQLTIRECQDCRLDAQSRQEPHSQAHHHIVTSHFDASHTKSCRAGI